MGAVWTLLAIGAFIGSLIMVGRETGPGTVIVVACLQIWVFVNDVRLNRARDGEKGDARE